MHRRAPGWTRWVWAYLEVAAILFCWCARREEEWVGEMPRAMSLRNLKISAAEWTKLDSVSVSAGAER